MAKMDMYNNVEPALHIKFEEQTATVTPAEGVDLQGYESNIFVITTGTITDGTWTVTFEHSDEADANFADASDYLIGTIPGPFTNAGSNYDDQIYKVGYRGDKQYVRVVVTMTVMGTSEFGCSVILGDPHDAPTPVTGYFA